jgi:hypothetical protein
MTRLDNGWRVPDANVWTGELIPYRLTFVWDDALRDVRLSYLDPVNDDRMFEVLWAQHGQDRSGHHKWRGVNALRQRAMMLEHSCMVCSRPATVDGRVPWLFHTDPERIAGGELLTNLPPTCRSCIPEALETCPPLRRQSRYCTAAGSRPYGIVADLYSPGDDATAVRVKRDVMLPLTSPILRFALAKQLWVALEDVQDASLP